MDYWRNLNALFGGSMRVYSCYGRFVGEDGSMGLRAGSVYAIDIYRSGGGIVAAAHTTRLRPSGEIG